MSAVEVVLATEQPRTLRLERELGDGAEAIVYEAEPDLAVKLFHSPSVEVTRRLESMMALARADDFLNDAAHPELAWPTALVHDADGREVVGYAMRRVGSPTSSRSRCCSATATGRISSARSAGASSSVSRAISPG